MCWSIFKTFFPADGLQFSFDIQDIAKYYVLYKNLMEFWHQKYPNKIFDVSYEKLTENIEKTSRDLFQFLEIGWDSNSLYFHKSTRAISSASQVRVRKEIFKGSSNEWKKYEERLRPMLNILNNNNFDHNPE